MPADPIVQFKEAQREGWSRFAPLAVFTTPPAAMLVEFAGVRAGQAVLDVACGTGVVAVTAARCGAKVRGLDLSPVLVEEARANAALIGAEIEFSAGDVEELPYPNAAFDVVLSQFGHMFAPRPEIAVAEMLRVLKPGGRIAFSTWPPELAVGRVFGLVATYLPAPPGVAPPPAWGDPAVVRQRLGDHVRDIEFDRGEMLVPALSPRHLRAAMELNVAPVAKVIEMLREEPERLAAFRADLETILGQYFALNRVRQSFLMTRGLKR